MMTELQFQMKKILMLPPCLLCGEHDRSGDGTIDWINCTECQRSECMKVAFDVVTVLTERMMTLLALCASLDRSINYHDVFKTT